MESKGHSEEWEMVGLGIHGRLGTSSESDQQTAVSMAWQLTADELSWVVVADWEELGENASNSADSCFVDIKCFTVCNEFVTFRPLSAVQLNSTMISQILCATGRPPALNSASIPLKITTNMIIESLLTVR
jgi:hypothetical protein